MNSLLSITSRRLTSMSKSCSRSKMRTLAKFVSLVSGWLSCLIARFRMVHFHWPILRTEVKNQRPSNRWLRGSPEQKHSLILATNNWPTISYLQFTSTIISRKMAPPTAGSRRFWRPPIAYFDLDPVVCYVWKLWFWWSEAHRIMSYIDIKFLWATFVRPPRTRMISLLSLGCRPLQVPMHSIPLRSLNKLDMNSPKSLASMKKMKKANKSVHNHQKQHLSQLTRPSTLQIPLSRCQKQQKKEQQTKLWEEVKNRNQRPSAKTVSPNKL